jgi:hypothetical protein
VLTAWINQGLAASNSIRSRLDVTYNTSDANVLLAGTGLDWFWDIFPDDFTNRKPPDLLS